jgi:glycosyltransferase involved in cell wall biosynthesis
MSLTILSVGYPLAHVGPDAVGGAEQILSALDEAFVRAGHRSIVLAPEGSITRGELVATPMPRGSLDEDAKRAARAACRGALGEILKTRKIDVIHFHGVDFHEYLPETGVPALVTLHLPPSFYPREAFAPRPGVFLHCVSASQRASCPDAAWLLPDIPNGVDTRRFHPRGRPRDYALVLSRICPEKGIHLALDAADRARFGLVLAGHVHPYPEHEAYHREEVLPRLGPGKVLAGALTGIRKERLLAAARCVVIPSLVAETSSLVAMEALASGTPVVAFRVGALPSIVEHNRTGLLVDSVEQMASAIRSSRWIDRGDCRRAALAKFSRGAMIERYLATYERLAREAGVTRGPAR